jgi:hypothetical protein
MAKLSPALLRKARGHVPGLNMALNFAEGRFDQVKMNQGKILARLNRSLSSTRLQDFEFKVFSQWGEDGIIQRLISVVPLADRTFIEFGVEDFSESNCRFLMMNDNFSGFVMDGSADNVAACRSAYYYWKHALEMRQAFITRDNINQLLAESGFGPDLAILSVDLDGVDYWVTEAIERFTPRILIHEYNAVFGAERKISVPYDPAFVRSDKHVSRLYWGASLAALTYLAEKRGYSLVGTNSAGCNAFYVRNDLLNDQLEVLSAERGYTASLYRESKDAAGNLTYVAGTDRLKLLSGMPVINVETGLEEKL